jgi:mRNA turnover protein 4
MAKSKRAKIVTMTKAGKKTQERKQTLFQQVRDAADTFQNIHVFSVENMRNNFLKEIREELKDTGRFFFGKNKVMAKSLGLSAEQEYKKNFMLLAQQLEGDVGLLFTNSDAETIQSYFAKFSQKDYARAGFTAIETITIPSGVVSRGDERFPHNMEPQLRSLGMPTRLNQGIVTLDRDYVICKEGDVLSSDQAQLLKHFYITMAEFHIVLKGYWSNNEFIMPTEE